MEYMNYIQPLQIMVSDSVYERQDAFKIYREQMKGSLDKQTLDEIYPYRWNPDKPNFWRDDDLLEIGFMTAITTLERLGAINHDKLQPLRGISEDENEEVFTYADFIEFIAEDWHKYCEGKESGKNAK